MRVEIVAVGTELLLGQIADTNSAWMGEQLAAGGVDSHFHQAVGDNQARVVLALRTALSRSDAVIVCGGLGPTQDDITRECIAEVMNVGLVRDDQVIERIRTMFVSRRRAMPDNNLRQADVPVGASIIGQTRGTAPGLICPLGHKVVYAVPGVPHEMRDMFERAILPDLQRRMADAGEEAVIKSRVIRTWGASESGLAEALGDRVTELDDWKSDDGSTLTIAFLASGIEGIKVRLTARAATGARADEVLADEERRVRGVLEERLGDIVFGVDDEAMEHAIAGLLVPRKLTLGLAESLTGGLIGARLVNVAGSSQWFRGCIVAYDSAVKHTLLGVAPGPVVSAEAAEEMALGARQALGSDVGLGITGVAGPGSQDGQGPGTVFVGIALPDAPVVTHRLHLPGDRDRVRQFSAISALDILRRALTASNL
ncbi:MAG: competence/damage-inducible protein A [Acidimicrobiales bacterium]